MPTWLGLCVKEAEDAKMLGWHLSVKNGFIEFADTATQGVGKSPCRRARSEEGTSSTTKPSERVHVVLDAHPERFQEAGRSDSRPCSPSGSIITQKVGIANSAAMDSSAYGESRSFVSTEAQMGQDGGLDVLPSIGTRLHSGGTCTPCFFSFTHAGCKHDRTCNFCHFQDHQVRVSKSRRPSRGVRAGYLRATEDILSSGQSPSLKLAALAKDAGNNTCIAGVVKKAKHQINMQTVSLPSA